MSQIALGLIETRGLVGAIDGLLQVQAGADTRYFLERAGKSFEPCERRAVAATFLEAYRYQYILSGIQQTRFPELLRTMIDEAQFGRIATALAALS